jgi:hypothetical protein
MSSFNAILKFSDGKEFEVLSCNYSFDQTTDEKNRPGSKVQGGSIFVQITSSADTFLLGWMVNPSKKTNGSIIFKMIDDEEATMKELEFVDAYCVGYSESFSSIAPSSMALSLSIAARKITVSGVKLENYS